MNCLCRRFLTVNTLRLVLHHELIRKSSYLAQFRVNNSITSQNFQSFNNFQVRNKSKKSKEKEDEDDDIFHDEDASLNKDSKVAKFNTTSMRSDIILKSALGIARNKIEQQFYESRIRINGKKILKKSASARVGDEIDLIKKVSDKNPNHLYVARVELLNAVANEDSITVTVRRFRNLLIDNYETDPYKGNAESN